MNLRTIIFSALLLGAAATANAAAAMIDVRETAKGTYEVTARFEVATPAADVHAVLTDYGRLPEFVPDIRTSIVRERKGDVVIVEQEAVSKFLLFSKKIHLLLEIEEGPRMIAFRDTSGKSFVSYTGSWVLEERGGGTVLTYTLAVSPSFTAPIFVIRRMLDRNARKMIELLSNEIDARSREISGKDHALLSGNRQLCTPGASYPVAAAYSS